MGDDKEPSEFAEFYESKTLLTFGKFAKFLDAILGREKNHADQIRKRFGALEARIEELEKTPFAYDGPYEAGKVYDKGKFVTHNGSLWHANYKSASKPGDGPAWTLAVKKGVDAR